PVLGGVCDPRGLAEHEYPARQAFPRGEREGLAERLELAGPVAGVPGADAVKDALLRIDLPDRAELPAERAADHLEDRLVRLDRLVGFRENPSHRMLCALEVLRLGDSPLPPGLGHGPGRRYTR